MLTITAKPSALDVSNDEIDALLALVPDVTLRFNLRVAMQKLRHHALQVGARAAADDLSDASDLTPDMVLAKHLADSLRRSADDYHSHVIEHGTFSIRNEVIWARAKAYGEGMPDMVHDALRAAR